MASEHLEKLWQAWQSHGLQNHSDEELNALYEQLTEEEQDELHGRTQTALSERLQADRASLRAKRDHR